MKKFKLTKIILVVCGVLIVSMIVCGELKDYSSILSYKIRQVINPLNDYADAGKFYNTSRLVFKEKFELDGLDELLLDAQEYLKRPNFLYSEAHKKLDKVYNEFLSDQFIQKVYNTVSRDIRAGFIYENDYNYVGGTEVVVARRMQVAYYVGQKIGYPEKDLDHLKLYAYGTPEERKYLFGLMLLDKGKKMIEEISYLDAPYLMQKAYSYMSQTDHKNAAEYRGEIEKLWPIAHFSRGQYLEKKKYFIQAQESYETAKKLGYDCSNDIARITDSIENYPELNENNNGFVVGGAGMSLIIDNGEVKKIEFFNPDDRI